MIKITPDKYLLQKLYINENKTVAEIAKEFNVSTATINRYLKQFDLHKSDDMRKKAISKTKQAKSPEEKAIYSQHVSDGRKGKGLGVEPWNKGKHTGNGWLGKHHSEDTKQKISDTKQNKTPEEKAAIEAKRLASRTYGDPWNKGICLGPWPEDFKQKVLAKQYITKKANNSFNSSKPEDRYYEVLIAQYGKDDVKRHYREDPRYPFECDFYIPSKDLFIELNLDWTHGGKPFEDTEEDNKKLDIWKQKALNSKFYQNAIETWIVRDPAKFKAALDNNLNYITYYNEAELYD